MRRLHVLCIVLLGVLIAAGCADDAPVKANDVFADCTIRPEALCPDANLRSVSLVSADMSGMDLTRAQLSGADLREVDLTGARLVDADLSSVDLTNANLTNADLSNAALNFTNFSGANMSGTKLDGATVCNTTRSDGRLDKGICNVTTTTSPGAVTSAPTILFFQAVPPAKCISDGVGDGLRVEWAARNVVGITFLVDNLRVDGSTKQRGNVRVPFACDDKPHRVTMQAYGIPPLATASFELALGPGTAPKPPS